MSGPSHYLTSPALWLSIGLFAQALWSMDTNTEMRRLDASIEESVTRMEGEIVRLKGQIDNIENLRGLDK